MTTRWVLAFVAALIAGCGSDGGPEYVDVTGRITVSGQPVPGLRVSFRLPDGPEAIGTTDVDGKYTLSLPGGIQGALIGSNSVSIVRRDVSSISPDNFEEMKAEAESSGKPFLDPTKLPLIPARYNENTELTAQVAYDKKVFDFDLTVRGGGK